MSEIPRDELLSAYLDGELSPEEKARAERLLAEEPAARQQLDDLRALSQAVRALPKMTLGEDLAERVLRAAERRVLAGATGQPAPSEPPEWLTWRSVLRRLGNRRALAWSGIAVAVALLVSVLQPEVAQPPARDKLARAEHHVPREAPIMRAVEEPRDLKPAAGESDGASSSLSSSVDESVAKAAEPARGRDADSLKDDSLPREESPPSSPTLAGPGGPAAAGYAPAAARPKAGEVAAKPSAAPVGAIPPSVSEPAAPTQTPPPSHYSMKGGPADSPRLGDDYSRGSAMKGVAGKDGQATRPGFTPTPGSQEEEVQPVLVVRCVVKPGADLRASFGQILAQQNIIVENEPPAGPAVQSKAAARTTLAAPSVPMGSGGGMMGGVARGADRSAPPADKGAPTDAPRALAGTTGMGLAGTGVTGPSIPDQPSEPTQVLVEADWDQVEATLGEMARQEDLFASGLAESAPGAAEQVPPVIARFNWGLPKPPAEPVAGQKVESKHGEEAGPQSDSVRGEPEMAIDKALPDERNDQAGARQLAGQPEPAGQERPIREAQPAEPQQAEPGGRPRGYAQWLDSPQPGFNFRFGNRSSLAEGAEAGRRTNDAASSWGYGPPGQQANPGLSAGTAQPGQAAQALPPANQPQSPATRSPQSGSQLQPPAGELQRQVARPYPQPSGSQAFRGHQPAQQARSGGSFAQQGRYRVLFEFHVASSEADAVKSAAEPAAASRVAPPPAAAERSAPAPNPAAPSPPPSKP